MARQALPWLAAYGPGGEYAEKPDCAAGVGGIGVSAKPPSGGPPMHSEEPPEPTSNRAAECRALLEALLVPFGRPSTEACKASVRRRVIRKDPTSPGYAMKVAELVTQVIHQVNACNKLALSPLTLDDVLAHMSGGPALLACREQAHTKSVLAQGALKLVGAAGRANKAEVLGILATANEQGTLKRQVVQDLCAVSKSHVNKAIAKETKHVAAVLEASKTPSKTTSNTPNGTPASASKTPNKTASNTPNGTPASASKTPNKTASNTPNKPAASAGKTPNKSAAAKSKSAGVGGLFRTMHTVPGKKREGKSKLAEKVLSLYTIVYLPLPVCS